MYPIVDSVAYAGTAVRICEISEGLELAIEALLEHVLCLFKISVRTFTVCRTGQPTGRACGAGMPMTGGILATAAGRCCSEEATGEVSTVTADEENEGCVNASQMQSRYLIATAINYEFHQLIKNGYVLTKL